jgi:hypothetical protein
MFLLVVAELGVAGSFGRTLLTMEKKRHSVARHALAWLGTVNGKNTGVCDIICSVAVLKRL